MNQTDAFLGPRLKVQWADRHIDEVSSFLDQFLSTDFCRAVVEETSDFPPQYRLRVFAGPLPANFALLIGDAIHNLRSSLDHFATAIVGTADRNIYFPFHEEQRSFASCGKVATLEKAIPGLGRFIIEKVRPYKAGTFDLWGLNRLDNFDKHKLIIPLLGVNQVRLTDVESDSGLSIGVVEASVSSSGVLNLVRSDSRIHIRGQISPSFVIKFPKDSPFADQPLVHTLRRLSSAVSTALNELQTFLTSKSHERDG